MIRIKIDLKEQRNIFSLLISRFDGGFRKTSEFLGISKSSLSKYKRGITRYIPINVLKKTVKYLDLEMPEIKESGSLYEIRRNHMLKAHPILIKKYGSNWPHQLTKRRASVGISLKDFPDYLYIYLDENFRKRFLQAACNLAGSREKLSASINISVSRLTYWFRGEQRDYRTNKIAKQFIPLTKLRLLSQLLVVDGRNEFAMNKVEQKTTMYRMRAGNPISNPKFEIKHSAELTRVLFHLLGDGYNGNNKDRGNYRNTDETLLKEFEDDLCEVFGDVPTYRQEYSIKFPRVLAEIVENYYQVNSLCYKGKISKEIEMLPKELLYQGIRAFCDDEATVYPSSIRVSSANKNLLLGIKDLLSEYLHFKSLHFGSQKNERAKYGVTYYLDIKDIELYHKHIGFRKPIKKQKLAKFIRERKRRNRIKELKT